MSKITSVEKLKQRRDELSVRIQCVEAREKSKERKRDLQRKILVGSYYLEMAYKENKVETLIKRLDSFLTRDSDRALFNLPKLDQSKITTEK